MTTYSIIRSIWNYITDKDLKELRVEQEERGFQVACALIESHEINEASRRLIAYSNQIGRETEEVRRQVAIKTQELIQSRRPCRSAV